MKIKIYIDKSKINSEGGCPLKFIIHHNGKQISLQARENVKVEAWDHKNQTVKRKGGQKFVPELNQALAWKRGFIEEVFRNCQRDNVPFTKSLLQKQFNERFEVEPQTKNKEEKEKEEKQKELTLFQFFDHYVAKFKNQRSPEYLRGFRQVKDKIQKYYPVLAWEKIDHNFLTAYTSHMVDEGLKNNYIVNHVKKLKQIMKEADREDIKVKKDYLDFTYKGANIKPFWLTWEEVNHLAAFETDRASWRQVLDEFLFRCYTGIRHSDSKALTPNNIKEHEGHYYLDFISVKTGKQEKIVLNKKAREIVEKYEFKVPVISQQKCNTYIKWICQTAGIEGEEQRVNYVGAQRTVEVTPRWKMVSTHTARRTFSRRWADQGGDITKLSKYLGHSSVAITMKYIGYENKEIDNEMLRLFD